MSRRRTPQKPLFPGFGWLLLILFLLGLLFGTFGLLSQWTTFQRNSPLDTLAP